MVRYQIPNKESSCTGNKNDSLIIPKELPSLLNNALSFEEYKSIVETCDNYITRRSFIFFTFFAIPLGFGLSILVATKDSIPDGYFMIPGACSIVFIAIATPIFYLVWKKGFNNKINLLNSKYSNRGIKIGKFTTYHGRNKNRYSIINIYIDYDASLNVNSKETIEMYSFSNNNTTITNNNDTTTTNNNNTTTTNNNDSNYNNNYDNKNNNNNNELNNLSPLQRQFSPSLPPPPPPPLIVPNEYSGYQLNRSFEEACDNVSVDMEEFNR